MTTQQSRASGPGLPVVVGVDGSTTSEAALAWAAGYAAMAGLPLSVILSWHYPTEYGWALPLPNDWNPATDAKRTLDDEVASVLGPAPAVPVTTRVVEGPAQRVLVEASRTASIVVVASRGLGQFAGMLLGSVSEYLTAHAQCPVVVVRDGAGASDGAGPVHPGRVPARGQEQGADR